MSGYVCACGRSSSCLCELLPTAPADRDREQLAAGEEVPGVPSALYEELHRAILDDMREVGYTGSWTHSAVRVLMRREAATAAIAERKATERAAAELEAAAAEAERREYMTREVRAGALLVVDINRARADALEATT